MKEKKSWGSFLLAAASLLFLGYAAPGYFIDRVGNTELNGEGCNCHTLMEPSPEIYVKVTGPDTLIAGETGIYKMFLAGGIAIAGGYNVAARFGTLGVTDSISTLLGGELMHSFPLEFPSLTDTILWAFSYTAPDSVSIDTIYSAGLTCDFDGNPLTDDFWNFGPKFPVVILPSSVPVELNSFTSAVSDGKVILKWETASETNNKGFQIERLKDYKSEKLQAWKNIGFIPGYGTTTEIKNYSFADENIENGKYRYKLIQIDFDGTRNIKKEIEVDVNSLPGRFTLYQNYPNPFNPVTKIKYSIPAASSPFRKGRTEEGFVRLKVYDILGNQVAILVNEYKEPGKYEIVWNAAGLPSGVYYYELRSGDFKDIKKLLLVK